MTEPSATTPAELLGNPALLEELRNGRTPLALRCRAFIADRYDGGPPFRNPIPLHDWADGLAHARTTAPQLPRADVNPVVTAPGLT